MPRMKLVIHLPPFGSAFWLNGFVALLCFVSMFYSFNHWPHSPWIAYFNMAAGLGNLACSLHSLCVYQDSHED